MRLDQRIQLAISATIVLSAVGIACAQGQVVGWGDNQFEVVSQSVTSLLAPVRLAGAQESSFVLQRDGTVLSWGGNGNGQRNLPSDASSLTCIDMGEAHGLAILANGSVIGWGRNDDSQAARLVIGRLKDAYASRNTEAPGSVPEARVAQVDAWLAQMLAMGDG